LQEQQPGWHQSEGAVQRAKYESDNRWFRGKGIGASVAQNIARSKADLDGKNQLAGQVNTNMRAVWISTSGRLRTPTRPTSPTSSRAW
jgi:hypothetical protein